METKRAAGLCPYDLLLPSDLKTLRLDQVDESKGLDGRNVP